MKFVLFRHKHSERDAHKYLAHGIHNAGNGRTSPAQNFNPGVRQRPIITAGDAGRYANDWQQVAFNSPVNGTIAPNSPKTVNEVLLNFQDHLVQSAGAGNTGTLPQRTLTTGNLTAAYTWKPSIGS